MQFSELEMKAIRQIADECDRGLAAQGNLRRRIELPSEDAVDTMHLSKEGERLAYKMRSKNSED